MIFYIPDFVFWKEILKTLYLRNLYFGIIQNYEAVLLVFQIMWVQEEK